MHLVEYNLRVLLHPLIDAGLLNHNKFRHWWRSSVLMIYILQLHNFWGDFIRAKFGCQFITSKICNHFPCSQFASWIQTYFTNGYAFSTFVFCIYERLIERQQRHTFKLKGPARLGIFFDICNLACRRIVWVRSHCFGSVNENLIIR